MARTNIQIENQPRAITQKIRVSQLWFLCSALHLNVFYQCIKFHFDSLYSLKVKARTKFGWTDGQADKVTPVYLPKLHLVGVK